MNQLKFIGVTGIDHEPSFARPNQSAWHRQTLAL
jgi:hypothetical protein